MQPPRSQLLNAAQGTRRTAVRQLTVPALARGAEDDESRRLARLPRETVENDPQLARTCYECLLTVVLEQRRSIIAPHSLPGPRGKAALPNLSASTVTVCHPADRASSATILPWRASGPGPCMPVACGLGPFGLGWCACAFAMSRDAGSASIVARRPPQSAGCMPTRMPRRRGAQAGAGVASGGGRSDGLARARSRPSIEQARPGPARNGFNILSEPPY